MKHFNYLTKRLALVLFVLSFVFASSGQVSSTGTTHSIATNEAFSKTPDAVDDVPADLKVRKTTGDTATYEGYVKFDISTLDVEELIGASVVAYGGQHNPDGESMVDPFWIDMYGVDTEWPSTFTWNTTRDLSRSDFVLGSDNIQDFADDYTFTSTDLVSYIKSKKAEGATEIAFIFLARNEQAWDIWLSGTWMGMDLNFEFGSVDSPAAVHTVDTEEAYSGSPDAVDDVPADLKVRKTTGDTATYEGYVKFDISLLDVSNLIGASVIAYGGQHNPNGEAMVDPFTINMYGVDTDWPSTFTWNTTRGLKRSDFVLGSDNIQGYANDYTFTSADLVSYIKSRKAAGATEIAFIFLAKDEQAWDIWLSGTWQGMNLTFEYGEAPTPAVVHTVDTEEAYSGSPDAVDDVPADLKVRMTADDSETYEGYVKFDISLLKVDSLIGASVIAYGGQHNPDGVAMVDPFTIDMYSVSTNWPSTFTWNTTRSLTVGTVLLGSDNIQGYADDYTFTSADLLSYIRTQKALGATEVAFIFKAHDEQAWDIWLSGTWQGMNLEFQYGETSTPDAVHSIDTEEAYSGSPDAVDDVPADLKVRKTTGDTATYEGYVKFDISTLKIDSLIGASVVAYGGQHNPNGEAMVDPFTINMYGADTNWPSTFTWNTTRGLSRSDFVLGSTNVQGFADDYTFTSADLVSYIKSRKAAGANTIAFIFLAKDEQAWDIWLSGTWQGMNLNFEYGEAPLPTAVHSVDTEEAYSGSPDAVDDVPADLKVRKTTGDTATYEGYVKFDISTLKIDSLIGASVIAYGGQHNPNGEAMVDPFTINMYGVDTNWPSIFTWNTTRGLSRSDFVLGSTNVQGYADDYTFTSADLVSYIKSRKAAGATEVAFIFLAKDEQAWDIWLSGTWQGMNLTFEYGELPTPSAVHSVDTEEAYSGSPDAEDDVPADLKVRKTTGDTATYEGYVKFDISTLNIDSLIGASVVAYGGQHNPDGEDMVDPFIINMYGVDTDWPSTFTWNTTRGLKRSDFVLGSTNVQGYADDYTFTSADLVSYIKSRKAAGATEVAFIFLAKDEQSWDIWLSGTWQGMNLTFEYGEAPTPAAVHTVDTEEAYSGSPDAEDDVPADLKVRTTSGDSETYEGYVKFDISLLKVDSLIGASVIAYGGQHNSDGAALINPYMIDMYGVDTDWPSTFTWNTTRSLVRGTDVLGSDDIQAYADDYTFSSDDLVTYLKDKKAEGAKEVAFVFLARDEQDWDIWLSGTWQGMNLEFEYGIPDAVDLIVQRTTVSVFPNPASDQLTLSNLSSGSIVTIYSISGSKILDIRNGQESVVKVGMEKFMSGLYLIRIMDAHSNIQDFKVIKR